MGVFQAAELGRSSRGTLKAMRSSAVVTVSSFTSKRSRNAAITSSTSASGAEAPAVTAQPFNVCPRDVPGSLDEACRGAAGPFCHLDEAQRVGALWAADHEQAADLRRDGFDRRLAVRRGVADVFLVGADDARKAPAQDPDDRGRVVDRERGLGDEGELSGVARHESFGIGCCFDQGHGPVRQLPHGAYHLRVPGVADEQDLQAFLVVAGGLDVHLEHQRAGGIEDEHIAGLGRGRHGLGDPVCRKDHGLVGLWYVVQLFHKNGTFSPQGINDKSVVNDLMAHVDGSAIFGQSQFDDLNGSVHAGAESARGRKVNGQGWPGMGRWR
jgi:hypothetical protein